MLGETLNYWVAFGAIVMQVGLVGLIALFFLRKKPNLAPLATFLEKWGLWFGLALTLGASSLTLFYSEIIGYPPCPLCWWQRVFMFPMVVLFALALWRKERFIANYAIALSVVGLGIALYHHALQILPHGSLPCPAEGTVSCAQRFLFEFEYITFPLLAATLFAFLIALMLFVRNRA